MLSYSCLCHLIFNFLEFIYTMPLYRKKFIFFLILFLTVSCLLPRVLEAYVMESSNFRLQQDSLNFGGVDSASASFGLEDTLGEMASGYSTSTSFMLHAGYQQMPEAFLTMQVPVSLAMSPDIKGLSGGLAEGSAAAVVSTNNSSGYTLLVKSLTDPAMFNIASSTVFFADYSPAGADPDLAWSVASAAASFGFTPEGEDIADRYRDNGFSCNQESGNDTPDACWDGLATNYQAISRSAAPSDGATTTVKFKAEIGNGKSQPGGAYKATIIFTAVSN